MADLYLDGSQPYHRHDNDPFIHMWDAASPSCAGGSGAGSRPVLRVHVFDPDALTAHDTAVAAAAEAGEPDAPLYHPDHWDWVLLEPGEPGQPATDCRVVAGWDHTGTFHRYASPEALARRFRDYVEREV